MATTTVTQLPLYSQTPFRYGTNLEGTAKQLTFYWNARSAQWHMDIRNEDQTEVVLGVPLVAEYPMLADHPMTSSSLTGYFVLLPITTGTADALSAAYTVLSEFYELYYIYITE